MGRKAWKGKWFGAVKKVFSPESKEKKEKLRKKAAGNPSPPLDLTPSTSLEVNISVPPPPALPSLHQLEVEVPEAAQEQNNHVSVEAVPAVPMQMSVLPPCIPREVLAATKIQTAFRGYLARRAIRALRGLARLKTLVDGNSIKRQAASTLRCMQTLARVQSQICLRRLKMSEENQALQRQLLLKQELDNFRMGEQWDDRAN